MGTIGDVGQHNSAPSLSTNGTADRSYMYASNNYLIRLGPSWWVFRDVRICSIYIGPLCMLNTSYLSFNLHIVRTLVAYCCSIVFPLAGAVWRRLR